MGVMTGETHDETAGAAHGERFERRRADIIAAAIPILNGQGFKGMRLTAVAELIGLRATGVTYYFPRKEELAVACLETGFAVFHDMLDQAETEPDAAARIARLIALHVSRDADVRRGQAASLASFAPIRALDGEHRARASEGYRRMFRRVRGLLDSPELEHLDKADRTIRTIVLLEQLYWANVWLGDYDLDFYPRLSARMTDIITNGMIGDGEERDIGGVGIRAGDTDTSKEGFLVAATRQINAHGYRGASVDRISASLNRTKGAFYHHNEAKDDLVAACFRRSFSIASEAQRQARAMEGAEVNRLIAAVAGLIRFQLGPDGPLLRASVLSSMPQAHQVEIMSEVERVNRQFAAMISDAIADGSIRPVDPAVAGALVHAAVNVASDARVLDFAGSPDIVDRFVRAIFCGLAAA
jgi:AcrR family transcriptional regulator